MRDVVVDADHAFVVEDIQCLRCLVCIQIQKRCRIFRIKAIKATAWQLAACVIMQQDSKRQRFRTA